MSQQDEINATAVQEETDIASIAASQASFTAAAASLSDKITALEQEIANNPTQPASQLDLTAAKQAAGDLHSAAQALASAATTVSSDQNPVTPPNPNVPDPNTPVTPTPDQPTPDQPTPEPTPAPADLTPTQAVYTFSGGVAPDNDPAWVPAQVNGTSIETADGQPLFFFGSDAPSTDPNTPPVANGDGVGGVWHVYDPSQGVEAVPTTGTPSAS